MFRPQPANGSGIGRLFIVLIAVTLGLSLRPSRAAETILYQTGFEATEGYDLDFTLAGQQQWVGDGSGGNGLVEDFFPEAGQQAFIGFAPPDQDGEFLSIWRPINFAPIPANRTVVRFSVVMQILDSTNGKHDDFRWSAYNTNGTRLFTLDFDNETGRINYLLDDNQFVFTGRTFDREGLYDLTIYFDFGRNFWTALLNGAVVVNSLPISTFPETPLSLGDVDAVWALHTVNQPGDNFMVFDNYRVASLDSTSIPPVLDPVHFQNGLFQFRLFGEEGVQYSIQVSSGDGWFDLGAFTAPVGGVFDFQDDTVADYPFGIYRAVTVNP